jgi:hypothetical protein
MSPLEAAKTSGYNENRDESKLGVLISVANEEN